MKEEDRRAGERNRGSIAVDAMLRCLHENRDESRSDDERRAQEAKEQDR